VPGIGNFSLRIPLVRLRALSSTPAPSPRVGQCLVLLFLMAGAAWLPHVATSIPRQAGAARQGAGPLSGPALGLFAHYLNVRLVGMCAALGATSPMMCGPYQRDAMPVNRGYAGYIP
jgi:hypothetical protein